MTDRANDGPLQQAVLAWGATERRDLPWRRTRDPWRVLVSEQMLQQTQVGRVLSRYEAFVAEFPTASACARSPVDAVIRAWSGLGYNRRALALHRAATVVVERHDGAVPDDLDALLALPGVGPYTARAVLAFAFERDVGVIDVNAARVLARAVAGRPLARQEAQAMADAIVPAGSGWAWNQALLDLGARWCRAVAGCATCPVAATCRWAVAGRPSPDPAAGTFGTGARQARFEGSDRQGRGRLVAALRVGPVDRDAAASAMGWNDDATRAGRVVASLVADGLVTETRGVLRLPTAGTHGDGMGRRTTAAMARGASGTPSSA